jgi:alginate O-acetyltransferase complex protein AlgJ
MAMALTWMSLNLGSCGVASAKQRVGFPWPMLEADSDPVRHAEVETLSPRSAASQVLIRAVRKPTRANLDYAAYFDNPMLATAPGIDISQLAFKPPRGTSPFEGVLAPSSLVGSLAETPLRPHEREKAMAFSPLVDYLSRWNPKAASSLEDARAAVLSESWGRAPSIQTTYQQITNVFRHVAGPGEPDPGVQWWVEVEFHPWAVLFSDMPDSDGDGAPEIYGRLRSDIVSSDVDARLRADYLSRELTGKEVLTWLNELASYWYPSYNTDIAIAGRKMAFPNEQTEPEIAAQLDGAVVEGVLFALRGKPDGKLIYNVFLVDGVGPAVEDKPPVEMKPTRVPKGVTVRTKELIGALRAELLEQGVEDYESWAEKLDRLHAKLQRLIAKRSDRLKGFVGKEGWLFFRGCLRYVVGGDLAAQAEGKNPLEAIVSFKKTLAALGVDFLLVPVPTKVEVYPEKLIDVKLLPAGRPPVLNPFGRKFLYALAEAGVESVDLLPIFLAYRASEPSYVEPLYLTQDTHWSRKGLGLAARAVAARVAQYPWFESLGDRRTYTRREVSFEEPGDLVSRLSSAESRKFRPMRVLADQVVDSKGAVYDDHPASPIVVLGDSFTGVFERTFTIGAGVSAQIAAELGYPVDLIMSYGGGPNVRRALMRTGREEMAKRRLVIWMFAARDLYDYYEDWEVLTFGKS